MPVQAMYRKLKVGPGTHEYGRPKRFLSGLPFPHYPLRNYNGTCFLNSDLQVLKKVRAFYRAFTGIYYSNVWPPLDEVPAGTPESESPKLLGWHIGSALKENPKLEAGTTRNVNARWSILDVHWIREEVPKVMIDTHTETGQGKRINLFDKTDFMTRFQDASEVLEKLARYIPEFGNLVAYKVTMDNKCKNPNGSVSGLSFRPQIQNFLKVKFLKIEYSNHSFSTQPPPTSLTTD